MPFLPSRFYLSTTITTAILLTGCGGGDSSPPPPPPPVNNAPVAQLVAAETTVREQSTITLNAGGSTDPDNDNLTYSYRVTAGSSVDLTGLTTSEISFQSPSIDADETLTIEVRVNDGALTSAASVSINLIANAPPQATFLASADNVEEGQALTLDASGSTDTEGDALIFSYVQIAGPTIDLSQASVSQLTLDAPEVDADAVVTIEVQVNDGRDISTSRIDFTVLNTVLTPVYDPQFNKVQSIDIAGEITAMSDVAYEAQNGVVLTKAPDGASGTSLIPFGFSGDDVLQGASTAAIDNSFSASARVRRSLSSPLIVIEEDANQLTFVDSSGQQIVDYSATTPFSIENPCDFISVKNSLAVGTTDGVSIFSYARNQGTRVSSETTRNSLEKVASFEMGNFCVLASDGVSQLLAFDPSDLTLKVLKTQTDINDPNKIMGLSLEKAEGIDGVTGVAELSYVAHDLYLFNGAPRGKMAIVLSDGNREGTHKLLIAEVNLAGDIRTQLLSWEVGTPSDVAFANTNPDETSDLIYVTARDIPQALTFRVAQSGFVSQNQTFLPVTGPEYVEVGLGAEFVGYDLGKANTSNAASTGVFIAYPKKNRLTRFDDPQNQ